MAVLWDPAYLAVRTTLWWLLWIFANVYGCLRRKARGKGWKLHWGVRAVLTTQILAETIRLATASTVHSESVVDVSKDGTFKTLVFFQNLNDAFFMFLLLLVSSGYCITRNTLGTHRNKVIGIPFAFGLTSMIVDYIILHSKSSDVITRRNESSEDVRGTILFVALAVKIVTFVLSWLFVFDNLSQEIRMLKGSEEFGAPSNEQNSDGDGEGEHEEAPPGLLTNGQNQSHMGGGQTDMETGRAEDEEEETTVEDIIMTSAKLKLLGRFFNWLLLYVVASVIVELLPVYINTKKSIEKFQDIMDVFHNVILFLFILVLSWIFRPMDDNPYLMVGDEFVADEEGPTTELGVIVSEENQPGHPTSATTRSSAGMKSEIDQNFALEDDEDLSELTYNNQAPNDSRKDGSPRKRPQHSPKKSS
ncbi:hypothetical protein BSKO_11022 [Bryopsis sp. KO-2023]|nr:hypothetical protein BSKO_11022 [Bryopsis sp. KO-2023]